MVSRDNLSLPTITLVPLSMVLLPLNSLLLFYSLCSVKMAGFLQVCRKFGTNKVLMESLTEPLKPSPVPTGHEGSYLVWKRLFFFVCCPAMAVAYINVLLAEKHERPEFKKYQHLRIRRKPFPWRDGVKTLFHNPHTNALPDGYETDH